MDENNIKKIWRSSNEKWEEALALSTKNAEDIAHLKVRGLLNSMGPIKLFTLIVGIVWVGLGMTILFHIYIYAFSEANKFFLFSASIQVGLTGLALYIYLYQLITIYRVDVTEPILKTQEKLASLKTSTLWVTRILFLQLPVWTTFYWNETMFSEWGFFQWLMQAIVTSAFTIIALWLFINIKYENRDKRWFRLIFEDNEWTPLMKSMELLEQVEEYKVGDNS